MFLHELKSPLGSRKRRKIVGRGRGSGHGKTSCRGQKGQKSRSGPGILNQLEGGQMPLIRRIPKMGFKSRRPILYQIVTLESLARFKAGTVVDVAALKDKGLIKSIYKPFKVLGTGEVKSALTVQAYGFSKSAADKIAKAGGKAEIVDRAAVLKAAEKAVKK